MEEDKVVTNFGEFRDEDENDKTLTEPQIEMVDQLEAQEWRQDNSSPQNKMYQTYMQASGKFFDKAQKTTASKDRRHEASAFTSNDLPMAVLMSQSSNSEGHLKIEKADFVPALSCQSGETMETERTSKMQKMTLSLFISINKRLWSVVFPAILGQLTLCLNETTSMLFVGNMDNTFATAGVGLGLLYVNCTTTGAVLGLNNAISVLVSVSYGKQDLQDCERILQRGKILCVLSLVPLFFWELLCYPIMVGCGIDPEVAEYGAYFGFFFFIAVCFHMVFDCYRQYLNATERSRIVQYAVSSTIALHAILCYVLTSWFDFGVAGVSFSMSVTFCLNMVFVTVYAWKFSGRNVEPFPRNWRQYLHKEDLKVYLGISGPSIVMYLAEFLAYDLIVVLATFISVGATGAMTICSNYLLLIMSFPVGFQMGLIAVVGNVIGEENEKLGKTICLISALESASITALLGLVTYTNAHEIAIMYTKDMDLVALLKGTLESLSLAIFLLGLTLSLQGMLKALQQQAIASKVLLLCLYVVSLPMAWWLSIEMEVGVTGLWTGFALGMLCIVLVYLLILCQIDWQQMFLINRARRSEEKQRLNLPTAEGEAEDSPQRIEKVAAIEA